MTENRQFRILVVDDKQEHLDSLKAAIPVMLSDLGNVEVETRSSFPEAELELGSPQSHYDAVVLDVMNGDPATDGYEPTQGVDLYKRLREVRWVPVVFYTGLPGQCDGLHTPPLVAVVSKDEPSELFEQLRAALESGASRTARELLHKLDSRLRGFLGLHAAPNWNAYQKLDPQEIERVLVGRLAAYLRDWDEPAKSGESEPIGHVAVPASYYLLPPLNGSGFRAGSILKHGAEWWIVLTPTCDLYTNASTLKQGEKLRSPKASRVLLARLSMVDTHPKIQKFLNDGSGIGEARRVLSGHQDETRWFYLPSFLSIPNLLVDLEFLQTEPHSVLEDPEWERIADLDTPYIESLLARQSHWRGRIGKPDLDWTIQLNSLKPEDPNQP
ncbi:hypothetical protein [Arthrobacter sp. NyZ413]|uniref:hypothetical protein n=1 Tax=Arthrobacter sp. NyZ413 TaxID=3144669 RepID=UPI003BF8B200